MKHGPCTANELVRAMREKDDQRTKGRDYFAQRLSELRDWGAIQEVGKRACKVTNRTVYVWDLTDRVPKKPKKDAPASEDADILKARIRSLEAENAMLKRQLSKWGRPRGGSRSLPEQATFL